MMKKLIRLFMVFVLLFTASCKANQESKIPARDDAIYIFFTSDVHCGIDENLTFPALKALVNDTKAEHKYVSLVDCGDYLQGGTLGTISEGGIIVELMNKMEYDAVTLGNHEFDYGITRLGECIDGMNFPVVLCNGSYTGTKENLFEKTKPYIMMDYSGTKVAFVGVTTPTLMVDSTPSYFMENDEFVYNFADGENGKNLAERVQETVDSARKEGAHYVILLSHLGSEQYAVPYDSISLIHNTRGIDAVLDGHSHSVIIGGRYPNADGEDVVLSSVGTKMANAGELIIGTDGTIETLLISEYGHEDETMRAAVDETAQELDSLLSAKVGELDFDLNIADEDGIRLVRSRETTAGNFCTDALRWQMETDVGVLIGGAVRSTIPAGDVTYGDLLLVFPFSNLVTSCTCTGQQILDLLEYGAKETQAIVSLDDNAVGEFGGFFQVSGLKYTIDTSVESGVIQDDGGMLKGFEGERRVKDVYVLKDGEYVPLDPAAEYTLATTDYIMFNAGDGNTVLQDSTPIISNGPMDISVLIEYFKHLGTIPDSYRETEGRITVK